MSGNTHVGQTATLMLNPQRAKNLFVGTAKFIESKDSKTSSLTTSGLLLTRVEWQQMYITSCSGDAVSP